METHAKVIRHLVSRIPKGRVTTYGQLATAAGMKGARAVGTILHRNNDPEAVPCHRVVNREGRLAAGYAFGGPNAQRQRLAAEGVMTTQTDALQVDLGRYGWNPEDALRSSL
jgi:methylated-DNA-protein-cysteine methyltransferase-like protein